MKQNILLGYRRKSLVRGKTDLVSPERQARQCELWVQMQDEDYIIEWYEDIEGHRSGRDEKNRPGWQELMRQLERPEVAGVIADSFDRMYRNVQQFLNFLNKMERLNKKLVTVKEGLDTSGHIGRAIVTILMVIYQLESDQTSYRMSANIKYKREELGRHWGPTPFGCDRNDDGHLIPTEKTYWLNPITGEAGNGDTPPADHWEQRRYYDALVLIYELYAAGSYSYDSVTIALNRDGWRFIDRWGKPRPFDRDDIRRALNYWQLFRGDLPTGKIQRAKGKVLEGGHQPILPVELCNKIGAIIGKRLAHRRAKGNTIYLLGNVLYCGVCQKKMTGVNKNNIRRYRHLGAKGNCPETPILADAIENELIERLMRLSDTELMEDIRAEAERMTRELFVNDDQGQAVISELETQRAKLEKLEDLYLGGDISKERYRQRKAGIDETIDQIETKLYSISQMDNINVVIRRIESAFAQLHDAPEESKKAVINSLFERVEAAGQKITHLEPRAWARGFF